MGRKNRRRHQRTADVEFAQQRPEQQDIRDMQGQIHQVISPRRVMRGRGPDVILDKQCRIPQRRNLRHVVRESPNASQADPRAQKIVVGEIQIVAGQK